jgi:hypothetical protein
MLLRSFFNGHLNFGYIFGLDETLIHRFRLIIMEVIYMIKFRKLNRWCDNINSCSFKY